MCFSVISGIFWLKLRDLSKNLIQRLKRTADVVGFWPPYTRSGFSGATEAQLARSQRRWKVDILGFPAIYNSSYFCPRFDGPNWRSKSAQECPALNAGTVTRMGVKRPNWHKSWRLTPRKVSTWKCFNAQPKHISSGPGSGFLFHLLISVHPKLLVLYK